MPRYILRYYGSETNGLIASISQFLGFIALLEMGIGPFVKSKLYKPLAEKNHIKISEVLISVQKYFNKIAIFFIIYICLLVLLYPLISAEVYNISTSFLIFALAINILAQYLIGLRNQLLLSADQKAYVHTLINIFSIVLSTSLSIIMIVRGYGIGIVKISSSIILLINPIFIYFYVKHNYRINSKIRLVTDPLKYKWGALAQHIAAVINNSVDVIVLTIFLSLKTVSIYSIYYSVVSAIKILIKSFTNSFQAFFGNLLAKNEIKLLNIYFDRYEWFIHFLVTYLFTLTGFLIVPFVLIYTNGIQDTNYEVPLFAFLITLATSVYSIRIPYQSIVIAAGHFKETQFSSVIEVLLNIFFSVVLVFNFGLIGVILATLIAMTYRSLYLVLYLKKNILGRNIGIFIKQFLVDLLSLGVLVIFSFLIKLQELNLFSWFIYASKLGIMFFILQITINLLFYNSITIYYFNRIKLIFKKN